MERTLFGTDGIRGEANVYPLTVQVAVRLGQAIAREFRGRGHTNRIIIGKDTRLSGYVFESALTAGVTSAGAEAWQVGVLPTPGIAYITRAFRAQAGVVISASHNDFQDNGLKVFGADGYKLPDAVEAHIEGLMDGDRLDGELPRGAGLGRAYRITDTLGRYVTHLKNAFDGDLSLDGMKVVVDCANGAAYKVVPAMFQELGADVIELGAAPNGTNINKGCGALHPARMAEMVRAVGAHVGFALDGDGDRLIAADEKGNIVDGDAILGICAADMKKRGSSGGNTVVATVMSNLGLERALKRLDIRLERTRVGDRYVVERMRAGGFNLGGEQSGHILFLDHATTGDGSLTALELLQVMVRTEQPLSDLARIVEKAPQVLVNVPIRERKPLAELDGVQRAIAAAEDRLGDEGRVLVRFSGTELKCRVMVEGTDRALIDQIAANVAEALHQAIGAAA